jgi:hypothetical protein
MEIELYLHEIGVNYINRNIFNFKFTRLYMFISVFYDCIGLLSEDYAKTAN